MKEFFKVSVLVVLLFLLAPFFGILLSVFVLGFVVGLPLWSIYQTFFVSGPHETEL